MFDITIRYFSVLNCVTFINFPFCVGHYVNSGDESTYVLVTHFVSL